MRIVNSICDKDPLDRQASRQSFRELRDLVKSMMTVVAKPVLGNARAG